ncbi:hypothetical protein VU14_15815 [Aeromonas hydrophila]|nr:hypothetical protein VU14_15815 [Aeromonas hydrophila]
MPQIFAAVFCPARPTAATGLISYEFLPLHISHRLFQVRMSIVVAFQELPRHQGPSIFVRSYIGPGQQTIRQSPLASQLKALFFLSDFCCGYSQAKLQIIELRMPSSRHVQTKSRHMHD